MRVYYYSGMQNMIEKSGVGRAIYHQRQAADMNGIELVDNLDDADIIHINTVFPGSLLMALRARLKHVRVVYHAHSTREDFRNSYMGSNMFSQLFGLWIKLCYSTADVIVTPTEYSKSLLRSYGIHRQIEAVSNGIDTDYYSRDNADVSRFRQRYGYSEDDKVVMSVGLPIDRKGILDFIELAERMPQYKFIWFGSTDMKLVPRKICRAMEEKIPNLTFAGYARREQLRDAYAGSDLFLFLSKEETEGIVVLEALAMEIPILLRDIPVYSDWLMDGKDVYKDRTLMAFEDRIEAILENKQPSLVKRGRAVTESRKLDRVGERLLEIYESALLSAVVPQTGINVSSVKSSVYRN